MEPDKIDKWLEQALEEYSRVEPRSGLQYRVLSSLKAQEARGTGRRRRPLMAAIVASVAMTAIWLGVPYVGRRPAITEHTLGSSSTQRSESSRIQKEFRKSSNQASVKGAHTSRRKHVSTLASVKSESTPKLDQFPSPHPLSEQEKLLIAYANQATEAVANTQLGNGHIEQIDIPPLQISSSISPSLDTQ